MKQPELIERIEENLGEFVSKAAIKNVLESLGQVIAEDLAAGNSTKLPGLGKLKPKENKAREGRNPKTGETIFIPAKLTVKFTPSKYLHEKMNPNRASSCGCKEG